ncbi:hypothetical protein FHS29_000354 [Saccharothrix tamanrassetensis]|uniref:Winged helix DNA-binding domain-containing protein n=1 Tax=Saccharothrix tamanrassetensis TaxID=1051531 RepID=A0A841CBQ4_9PSEU|nr:winged helix DNA-binding domain-containing protein [Saccharothrix tamanrassetensis]MBB5953784.1 hypothetical protein [Saccharothrix tamanrassetensis]
MRRVGDAQRRARLNARQGLDGSLGTADVADVVDSLVALHATDPSTVYLSVLARVPGSDTDLISKALYEERTLVRLLGMRRTMFVVSRELAPVVQAACSRSIAVAQRRRLVKQLEEGAGIKDAASWLADVEDATFAALVARGEATAAELSEDEPRLRTQIVMAAGKPYEAKQSVSSRVLFMLAIDARIVRGRPTGSWTTNTYRWAPMDRWLPGGLPELDPAEARAELLRRWLAAFGPATMADVKWWTGWTVGETKKAVAAVKPAEVELAGGTGFVLADDLDDVPESEPRAVLLPSLDPTPMGWVERDWYLGPHAAPLFDRSGNIGPTIWWDGRIVGAWGHRLDGEIAYRLLEDIGADGAEQVGALAARLGERIGDARVRTRFPTPLERELVG